ncbi:hypothetical protein BZA77DRAFT_171366 [Pyronema omphalodes]|nr:hypothetical protein BZA77DRAFT_171366 [Pyronema omphalodes]
MDIQRDREDRGFESKSIFHNCHSPQLLSRRHSHFHISPFPHFHSITRSQRQSQNQSQTTNREKKTNPIPLSLYQNQKKSKIIISSPHIPSQIPKNPKLQPKSNQSIYTKKKKKKINPKKSKIKKHLQTPCTKNQNPKPVVSTVEIGGCFCDL